MPRNQETFEQRHSKALDKAHAKLRTMLQHRPNCFGLDEDDFFACLEVYRDTMGYFRTRSNTTPMSTFGSMP